MPFDNTSNDFDLRVLTLTKTDKCQILATVVHCPCRIGVEYLIGIKNEEEEKTSMHFCQIAWHFREKPKDRLRVRERTVKL